MVTVFIVCALVSNYEYSTNLDMLPKEIDVPLKYILIWDEYWNLPRRYNEIFEDGSDIFKNCPVSNCFNTRNRSLVPMEELAAFIFHGMHYYETPENKPPNRRPEQVYIYFNLEPPIITPSYMSYSPNFFNWTMSYRYVYKY